MHPVIKCKGRSIPDRTYFSAFSSDGKCGSFLGLRFIWPCHMIVRNGDYSGHNKSL